MEELEAPLLRKESNPDIERESAEYFYGGGVQNGRFSHKGKGDFYREPEQLDRRGVASHSYYWSTNGYGMMWYTFKKGKYDFGASEEGKVKLSLPNQTIWDVFYMINDGAVALLNDF